MFRGAAALPVGRSTGPASPVDDGPAAAVPTLGAHRRPLPGEVRPPASAPVVARPAAPVPRRIGPATAFPGGIRTIGARPSHRYSTGARAQSPTDQRWRPAHSSSDQRRPARLRPAATGPAATGPGLGPAAAVPGLLRPQFGDLSAVVANAPAKANQSALDQRRPPSRCCPRCRWTSGDRSSRCSTSGVRPTRHSTSVVLPSSRSTNGARPTAAREVGFVGTEATGDDRQRPGVGCPAGGSGGQLNHAATTARRSPAFQARPNSAQAGRVGPRPDCRGSDPRCNGAEVCRTPVPVRGRHIDHAGATAGLGVAFAVAHAVPMSRRFTSLGSAQAAFVSQQCGDGPVGDGGGHQARVPLEVGGPGVPDSRRRRSNRGAQRHQ